MDHYTLHVLGSMGWIPTGNRQTCCYCLEIEGCDTLVVFDCGSGIARFDDAGMRRVLDKYKRVLILLSHYHWDHITGLGYLTFFFPDKELHIAGPGGSIYGRSVSELLDEIVKPPYFGLPLSQFPLNLTMHDLAPGSCEIAGVRLESILQQHSDPTLGIKVNGAVSYHTDTVCTAAGAQLEFIRGSRLLLHESWLDDDEYREMKEAGTAEAERTLSSHSAAGQAALTAQRAAVERLLLIHLNPAYDKNRLIALGNDAHRVFPATQTACDGDSIYL